MNVKRGKLNCFFIDSTLEWGAESPDVIFTNASEEEFNEILDNFISEMEAQDDEFDLDYFRTVVIKSGYYAYTEPNIVIPPYAPL